MRRLHVKVPGTLAIAVGAAALVAFSCGDGKDDSPPPSTTQIHGEHDQSDGRDSDLRELTRTDAFRQASERMNACLEDAGYVADEGAIILKDGTRYRPTERIGQPASSAELEYISTNLSCEEESGITALRRAAGVSNQPLDPKAVQKANQHAVSKAACMKARGWTFKAPFTLQGVTYFEPELEPGERDAYDLDEAECRAETIIP